MDTTPGFEAPAPDQAADTRPAARPAETYAEVEDALLAQVAGVALDPTLDRIEAFIELLGEPQRTYPVVHLTGTNGKTSTARMVETLIAALGLRTGRFTSPHLESMTERIVIDGEPLDEEAFVRAFNDVAPYTHLVDAEHDHPLSFFETVVAMAYAAFADAPVDAAVVEVGMGGAWDATNVADGTWPCSPRSRSTTRSTSETSPAIIAREKVGIIKPGATVIRAVQEPEVAALIVERCAEVGATLAREGLEFGVTSRVPAVGGPAALAAGPARHLRRRVPPALRRAPGAERRARPGGGRGVRRGRRRRWPPRSCSRRFAEVTSPGRLEIIRRSPTIVLDAAHNPHGAAAVVEALEDSFTFSPLIGVVGVMADKDYEGLLADVRAGARPHRLHPELHRAALPAHELAEVARGIFGQDRVSVSLRAGRRDRPGRHAGRGRRCVRRGTRLRGGAGHRVGDHRRRGARDAAAARNPTAASRERGALMQRRLCSAILLLEAIVLGLSHPGDDLGAGVVHGPALWIGLGLTVACILVAGPAALAWAYGLGWGIQVAAIALGFVVTAMFVLGAIFLVLWVTAFRLGSRDRPRAAEWAVTGDYPGRAPAARLPPS